MPDSDLQDKLALAGTKSMLTVLPQSLGFQEGFASSAALSIEEKPHNPPCNNLGTPESRNQDTAAHQFCTDV